jgi:putative hydrolase of the HAD superfamily
MSSALTPSLSRRERRIQAILFDAGGTLIHLDGQRICRAAGLDADAVTFKRAELGSMNAMRAWIAENPESTDRERLPAFLEGILSRLGLEDPRRRTDAARAVAAEHVRSNLWSHAADGAAETLSALSERGFRIGVVSNADGRVRRLLDEAGLSPFLQVVIDSSEVGVEKPDPRIFREASDRIETPPHACAYVGDIYEIDVIGARTAGFEPILIGPGEAPESDPVVRIGELRELLALFPDER